MEALGVRDVLIWMLVSYFIGSLPTGYLAARLVRGVDIRSVGSGSIGATNVRRLMGKGWGTFVAVVDMFKGALALLLTAHAGGAFPDSPSLLIALSAFAVVVGHNYPVWLKFCGGKGVATTYGTMFFVWPYHSFAIVLMCGAIWYGLMRLTRYVSLASMLSLAAMPAFFWMLDAPLPFTSVAAALAALSIFRHRANIRRLIRGEENAV
ncbi:MAG: glycerol-3-phosphate 1-O-acyltransferase PlsY [Fretibacterium sp.]|nr:glycerol-3-phosphate 1-O-acyltransferase PlsY [Fretibacterium sp.]